MHVRIVSSHETICTYTRRGKPCTDTDLLRKLIQSSMLTFTDHEWRLIKCKIWSPKRYTIGNTLLHTLIVTYFATVTRTCIRYQSCQLQLWTYHQRYSLFKLVCRVVNRIHNCETEVHRAAIHLNSRTFGYKWSYRYVLCTVKTLQTNIRNRANRPHFDKRSCRKCKYSQRFTASANRV
jgi:hypothetical protein